MKFRLACADRASGIERELTIEAANAQCARQQANDRGLLVSDCRLVDDETSDNTKTCPFCAETINVRAIKCRWCGEMLSNLPSSQIAMSTSITSAASPPPGTASSGDAHKTKRRLPRTSGPQKRSLWTPFIGVVLAGLWCWKGCRDDDDTALPISNISFVDFDAKFCAQSRLTKLQKGREIENLKGQRVRWEGTVSSVRDGKVGFKHKVTTLTDDVDVRVSNDERGKLLQLNEGDLVTYEGTIDDYGTVFSHTLKNGKIITRSPMSPDERQIFLAQTQTAVLNRIKDESVIK